MIISEVMVSSRMTRQMAERAKVAAHREGVTRSELIRRLLVKHLEKPNSKQEVKPNGKPKK